MNNLKSQTSLTRFLSLRIGLVAIIVMMVAGFTLAASWNNFGLFSSLKANAESSQQSFTIGTCDSGMAIEVEANGTSTGYASLTAAFAAINAGTHTGAINIEVCQTETEPAGSAVLNSGDATPASYTSVNIYPLADGLTISGASVVGKGLIELNGSDNVTIDGDNPGTAGINRNLTLTNTSLNTNGLTSVIRVAVLVTTVTSANNDTIKNLNLNGSATGRNLSTATSTAGSENTTFGIYVGGNGGATATTAPAVLSSVTANTAPTGTTVNAFTVSNNAINACARAVVFNGAVTSVSTGVTVSNNLIGDQSALAGAVPPYTTPATTVYTKGIFIAGTNVISITGNSVRNILSYVSTAMNGIELNTAIGAGPNDISNNTVIGVVNNSTANGSSERGIILSSSAGAYTLFGNTVSNVQQIATSFTPKPGGIEVSTAAPSALIDSNKVSMIYARTTGTGGSYGINLVAGNNITLQNNFVWDINQDMTGGAAFSTTFGVFGIRVAGGTGHKIYHNSVNLFGTQFGTPASSLLTAALSINATTQTGLDVRNNILANTLTGGTTSIAHVSLFLPVSGTSAMNLTLNNNDYFANTTAGSAGIAHVGTTYTAVPAGPTTYAGLYTAAQFDATMTTPTTNLRAYTSILSAAGTNDNASKVVDPQFLSNTDLHIAVASPMVDMGASLGVVKDIDNQLRVPPPDIGADEPSGITPPPNDIAATAILVPAPGSGVATGTVITPQASFTNIGSATQTNVMVSFTITGPGGYSYTNTQTIASIAPNQTVTVTFAAAPAIATAGTYNMTASVTTPDANAANDTVMGTFTANNPLSGTVTVGTAGTFTSLTNPGGLFEYLNNFGASSNITANITSDLTSETGTVSLNQIAGGFTLLIQPSGGAARTISGSNATVLLNFNGADGVTIDGLNTGGNSLTINTTTGGIIRYINDASNNTVRNCTLSGSANFSVINISTGTTTGNDNINISNNNMLSVGATPLFNGVFAAGTSTAISNSNLTVNNNLISEFGQGGILFNASCDNVTAVGNNISQTASRAGNLFGILLGTVTGGTNLISQNQIHGLASTSTFVTFGISLADVRATTVSRNRIYDFPSVAGATGEINGLRFTGASGTVASVTAVNNMITIAPTASTNQTIRGMYDFGFGGNIFTADNNSIYIGGTASGPASTWALERGTAAPTTFTARNNVLFNNRTGGAANHYAGGDDSGNTGTFVSNFNFFAGTGATTAANLMYYNGAGVPFATWQAGPPARDANSTAGVASTFDPATFFVNANAGDLHLLATATPLINTGTATAGVTIDIDGQTRDATPDIGADELGSPQPGTLALSSATYSVGEAAGTVTITVNRTGGTDNAVSVNYTLTNGTATGGATCGAGVDFVNTGGTVNFAAGQASNTFTVTICNDAVFEGNEAFNVTLSGATGGATIGSPSSAVVTITDDEVAVPGTLQFSSATYTVAENAAAGTATITVTRTGGSDNAVSVGYATVAGGTATGGVNCGAGVDYVNASGTLNWTNGDSAPKTFTITICNDSLDEADETVNLALSNATGGATIGAQSTAVLTITDDDATPSLAIASPSPTAEGNAGTTPFIFNVNLSAASGQTVTVHYSTADGTATAPSDYTAISDSILTFTPGQTSKQITVLVNGDTNFEANETFFVNLSNPTNATIQTPQGTGTILNDDAANGAVTINDVRTLEGDSGSHTVTFTATLTTPSTPPANASVQYATGGGTATPGASPPADYQAASGTLFFGAATEAEAAGGTDGGPVITTRSFTVTIFGDTNKEANETFFVTLSNPVGLNIGDGTGVGIIVDDDSARVSNFDGDLTSDLAVFRPSSNVSGANPNDSYWYVLQSTNGLTKYEHFGTNGDLITPGDYDGDTKTDYAVFRPSNGTWYIENSSNFTFRAQAWGASGDLRVQGDYDGDGKTDIAVFRPSNGTWYVLLSSEGSLMAVPFGTQGDIPVQGDYDGDARTDVAVFRPSTGTWYVISSRDSSVHSTKWGNANDKPVVGDFDGDGMADYTVFRPSNGTWYVLQSLTGTIRTQAWGTAEDIPVPADYDGDGTTDIAVWRPSTGDWHILKSAEIFSRPDAIDYVPEQRHFGQSGDDPVPDGYHP